MLMLPGTDAVTIGWLLPPLFLAGIGMGAAAPALFQSVMAVVPAGDSGVASGAAHDAADRRGSRHRNHRGSLRHGAR